MKTFLFLMLLSVLPRCIEAQILLPNIDLRSLEGEIFHSDQITERNQPSIVIFWRTSNTKCSDNLENMQSAWLSQLKDRGVQMVAICIDCNGTWNYVKPFVYGKEWEFDIFIDINGDFKRAMGVTDAPYTLLLDKNQKVVCRSAGYCSGNEEFVCKKILHCLEEADGDNRMHEIVRK